jgi:hypothetical protein
MKKARNPGLGKLALALVAIAAASALSSNLRWGDDSMVGVAEAATPPTKIQAAQQAFKIFEASYRSGSAPIESVYLWSKRWLDAERGPNRQAAKNHLRRMQALDAEAKKRVESGQATQADSAACAFYLAEASELVGSP